MLISTHRPQGHAYAGQQKRFFVAEILDCDWSNEGRERHHDTDQCGTCTNVYVGF